MNEIINIYEELEDKLSPTVTDVQSVMRAIDDAINFYNKSRNNPKYENIAPWKVGALNNLKKQIEASPNIILQHAEAYKKIAERKRLELEKEIREKGNIYVTNGEIKQANLSVLAIELKRNEDEILKILGVTVKKEKVFKDDGISEMNDGAMKSIGEKLAILDKKDIYDFLEINSTAPIDVCKKKTDEKYDYIKTDMNNSNPRVAAYKDLVQCCKEIFKDEKSRRSYNKALENIGFTSVRGVIVGMDRAKTRYISSEQYKTMLETCLKNGIDREHAEKLIYTTAKNHGIEVDEGSAASMVTCRFCYRLNILTDTKCCSCGRPLEVVCPKCQNIVAPEEETCTGCGLSIIGMMDAEKPPTGLSAKVNGRMVRLEWQPIDNKDISYLVFRKEKSRPVYIEDGELGKTNNPSFDDDTAVAGISYYYAVYSKWYNNHSSVPAYIFTPVMRVEELDGTDISIRMQATSLTFIFPSSEGLDGVEVIRDCKIVNPHAGNIFIDYGLQIGKTYNYCFKAIYKDSEDIIHQSPNGLCMSLTPMNILPKPVELKVQDDEKEATLTWDAPRTVMVQIYSSDTPFKQSENDLIHIDTFRASPQKSIGNSCVITKDYSGERYFLPVTIAGNIGVVGKVLAITSLGQVSNVSITRDKQVIKVEWEWKSLQAVDIIYVFDGNKTYSENIQRSLHSKSQFLISVPIEIKSVKVEIMPHVETKTGKALFGKPFINVVNMRPATVIFKSVINKKKYYFLPSDNYILHIRCDALLPCNLNLLINEGSALINLLAKKTDVVINKDKIVPNREVRIPFYYHRKKKGQAVFFRLIAADNNKVKEIVIRPDTQIIK